MPQPVKISDALLLDARLTGNVMNRSIAGQVEFWAQLGRSVERVLIGSQVHHLRDATPTLSEIVHSIVAAPDRVRLKAILDDEPFPHFLPVPGEKRLFDRIDEDGTRTRGHVRGREFIPSA